ncbi:hypothetical protein SNE40_018670 [Patella caerulea]|uniref:Uncharacterized protein n=1 Tax=Patella caerulea TaxID=87958 RepID=A0AAN8J824_PATCE
MVFTHLQSKEQNKPTFQSIEQANTDTKSVSPNDRYILVSAVGEVCLQPNNCRITISVTAKKDDAKDAKSSVSRRIEYIQQCLNNHGIKQNDRDIYERLTRDGRFYVMRTEITAKFSDVIKCQSLSNLLVEKLDQNVDISLPEFFHDDKDIESLRKQASLLAIHNAKLKAQEMAKLVHMEVGRTISIQEEETNENYPSSSNISPSVHQRKIDAVLTVSSKVSVQFELKKKNKQRS